MTRFLILPTAVATATLAISACNTTPKPQTHRVEPQVTAMPTPAPTPTPKPVTQTAPPPPAVKDIQVAKPVPGKPGFVTLPGSSGLIDVRGFSPGEQVKDPATGTLFLVP